MKKKTLFSGLILTLLGLFVFYTFNNKIQLKLDKPTQLKEEKSELKEKPEREKQIFQKVKTNFSPKNLTAKELEIYNKQQEDLEKNNYTFSSKAEISAYQKNAANNVIANPQSSVYNYANNTLQGKWHQYNLKLFDDSGFRSDGSVYDPVNEEFYIVTTPGHLYKIDENATIKWSIRNDKRSFRGDDLNGVNLPDGTFRLLHQKGDGGMEFSDDEGRTWLDANGAYFQNNGNYTTLVTKKGNGKRIVAHGSRLINNDAYHRFYISNDYGINYTTSNKTHLKTSEFNVKIVKPHNSRRIFCFAYRYSDGKVFIYRMNENDNDLIYIGNNITLDTSRGMSSVVATETGGYVRFYISSGQSHIYYSNNNGYGWTLKSDSNDQFEGDNDNLIGVHPTQPNICFKGFLQTAISYDYGVNWTRNAHTIGPADSYYVYDLQHFKTYDKEDGGNITFAGYDFGSYYSTNSSDWSSWVSINTGSPNMLSYDASTNETFNKVYSANQDRGVQSFSADNGNNDNYITSCKRESASDFLRATVGGNDDAVWLWGYTGFIRRLTINNDGTTSNNRVTDKIYLRFIATSIIASPDTSEDAVYIPWGKQLNKISYVGDSLARTYHPYVFPEPADCFGYSKLNTNRWYAGLRSGPLMYSTDGGNTFTQSSYAGIWPKSTSGWHKQRAVIATSPIDEATVYYAGEGNTFLISNNGGASFTKHANGLNVTRISDLSVSANGKYIFAACFEAGAWVYSVDNDQWFKMDGDAVPKDTFTSVQYINNTKTVRFGTFGSGIIDFNITNGATNTISDGIYKIQLVGSGKCMNVSGAGGDLAKVIQWDCGNYYNSKFKVEKQSNGTYEIKALYNNKSISVANGVPFNGSGVNIYTDLNQTNQRFRIQDSGNNSFYIRLNSLNKALCLLPNNLNTTGAKLAVWDTYNSSNFKWKFIPTTSFKEGDKKSISTNNLPEDLDKSFKIYPNPASDNFKISFNNFKKADVTISDVLGKVIYKTSTHKNNIDISKNEGFKSGIYLIKVIDDKGKVFNDKLIIN